MQEILNRFEPITLEDMKDIRLMNRIDTKFVTTMPVLRQLLKALWTVWATPARTLLTTSGSPS